MKISFIYVFSSLFFLLSENILTAISYAEKITEPTSMVLERLLGDGNWGSHMTPLITAVANTEGPILEMGSGDFSTPLLHALCAPTKRLLVTAETNKNWLSLFTDLVTDWHNFFYVPLVPNGETWNDIGKECHWSVVFIDHAPGERRIVDIQRLRNNSDIFVVHDTETSSYHYEPVFKTFKYRYTYKRYKTETTLISDTIDVSQLFKKRSIAHSKNLSSAITNRLSPSSLNHYHHSKYSQSGEDGIIEEIFKRLQIDQGFCVEFGAYNGITLSNTRQLWEKGWRGVMIEGDQNSFNTLKQNYSHSSTMLCLNEFIALQEGMDKTFDHIADLYFPDYEIDFLSIDIDGGDYLVLEGLHRKPKVICIEIGLHWHPLLATRIPDEYALQNRQQPILVMCDIADKKGYKPICFEGGNLFLVRNDLYTFFSDVPQNPFILWQDGWRSCPSSHDYLLHLRATDFIILKFEGDLNKKYPITKNF